MTTILTTESQFWSHFSAPFAHLASCLTHSHTLAFLSSLGEWFHWDDHCASPSTFLPRRPLVCIRRHSAMISACFFSPSIWLYLISTVLKVAFSSHLSFTNGSSLSLPPLLPSVHWAENGSSSRCRLLSVRAIYFDNWLVGVNAMVIGVMLIHSANLTRS